MNSTDAYGNSKEGNGHIDAVARDIAYLMANGNKSFVCNINSGESFIKKGQSFVAVDDDLLDFRSFSLSDEELTPSKSETFSWYIAAFIRRNQAKALFLFRENFKRSWSVMVIRPSDEDDNPFSVYKNTNKYSIYNVEDNEEKALPPNVEPTNLELRNMIDDLREELEMLSECIAVQVKINNHVMEGFGLI